MKRIFKLGFGNRKKNKKRLSPSANDSNSHDHHLTTDVEAFRASTPMLQFARNEFAQTVASGTSNDDGRSAIVYMSPYQTPSRLFTHLLPPDQQMLPHDYYEAIDEAVVLSPHAPAATVRANQGEQQHAIDDDNQSSRVNGLVTPATPAPAIPSGTSAPLQSSKDAVSTGNASFEPTPGIKQLQQRHEQQSPLQTPPLTAPQRQPNETAPPHGPRMPSTGYNPPQYQPNTKIQTAPFTSPHPLQSALKGSSNNQDATKDDNKDRIQNTDSNTVGVDDDYIAASIASTLGRQESLFSQTSSQYNLHKRRTGGNAEPGAMSDDNYYFSHHMKSILVPDAVYEEDYGDAYIGGPIRYIYPSGYQSMRPRSGPWKLSMVICVSFTWLSVFIVGHCSDRVDSDGSQYNQNEIDDDTLVIETRWCGSRLLYMMWVISMLVTGLAAAYCSIIGYIKVRDFAVANSRSQPPGMIGKTDFYARIDDAPNSLESGSQASSYEASHHHMPIYQADGNPQFWGGHIYRPTQAAVAITSR